MNIIERGRAFLGSLRELASRSLWDWKRCPRCESTLTCKWGTYDRHPWFFGGRRTVAVQRHMCHSGEHTYSERSALLIRGSWYAREVHRCAIDHWQHLGTALRRTAEVMRSWVGKQERYLLWRRLGAPPSEGEQCHLAASTVHRFCTGAPIPEPRGLLSETGRDMLLKPFQNEEVCGVVKRVINASEQIFSRGRWCDR